MTETIARFSLIGAAVCGALVWLLDLAGFKDASALIVPAILLAMTGLGLGWWEKTKAEAALPTSNTHGSAYEASAAELVAKAKASAAARGALVPLGKVNGAPMFHRTEKHVLMLVSAGGGKGVSYLLPNLLSYPGSVFVTDPKGENATISAGYRATLGKVCVLDPWEITSGEAARYRDTFNPLDAIMNGDRRQVLAKSKALAEAFGVVKQNDHWQNASKQLLTALIAHVCTAEKLGKLRDLVTVRELLMENFLPALEPEKGKPRSLKKGEEIRSEAAFPVSALEAMLINDACEGAIRREAAGLSRCAVEELSGILGTAKVATEFIEETCIRDSLRGRSQTPGPNAGVFGLGGLDFGDWRRGVLSVFLCVPARAIRDYPNYVRLVTVAALDTMLEREEVPQAGPVQFLLDELGYIGRLDSVEGALGLGRSYGVQIWGVFQNIGMIERDYGRTGIDTFWSNAGVRIVFASDSATSEYASKQTGQSTVATTSTSYSEGPAGANVGSGAGEAGRPLFTPHEVTIRAARDTGKALVFLDGMNVALLDRLRYYADEPFASRAMPQASS